MPTKKCGRFDTFSSAAIKDFIMLRNDFYKLDIDKLINGLSGLHSLKRNIIDHII